jgi:hypothetical protein
MSVRCCGLQNILVPKIPVIWMNITFDPQLLLYCISHNCIGLDESQLIYCYSSKPSHIGFYPFRQVDISS